MKINVDQDSTITTIEVKAIEPEPKFYDLEPEGDFSGASYDEMWGGR